MAVDKSTWNKKVKVSQSTINDIKSLGMTKALRLAKMNAKSPQEGLVAEYQEATRRLYGDRRFAAATGAAPKKPSTSYSPAPKKASTSYSPAPMGTKPKKASTSYSPAPMKTPAKKDNTKSNILKGVAGTAAAVGILALGKSKGAGLATKLAPGLMKNKYAQAALTGEIKKKVATKASTAAVKGKDAVAATTGRMAARAGKAVSQTQYDAMVAAARSQGTKTVAKKTAAKKVATKKASLSAGKRWDANAPKPKAPKIK